MISIWSVKAVEKAEISYGENNPVIADGTAPVGGAESHLDRRNI